MSNSYTDSLDFTHLEAETDDSIGVYAAENAVAQPTIALPPPPQVNRGRKRSEKDPNEGNSFSEAAVLPSNTTVQDQVSAKSPRGEAFEDAFVNGPSVQEQTADSRLTSENAENTAETNGTTPAASSFKIHYDSSKGNVTVLDGQVRTRPDGSQYINTQGIHDQYEEQYDRPLRKKRIRFIKIFSIIASVFFFPSGIAAVYYAFRTQKEFEAGIMRGNIDRAQKFAKRSERLIVLSFVLAFMLAALIVALVERPYFEDRDYHRGTIVG